MSARNPQRVPAPSPRCHAFTLVELLVVIGIIAVLIGILLPSLNKARESARGIKCMSNMRNLAQATLMFAQEHRGLMPGRGGTQVLVQSPTGIVRAATSAESKAPDSILGSCVDWIEWMREKDPISSSTDTASGAYLNITYSGLAKYLGVKPTLTTGADASNAIADKLQELYRCPSDNLNNRPKNSGDNNGHRGMYRYSYSMNMLVAIRDGNPYTIVPPSTTGAPGGPYAADDRLWGKFSGKLASIRGSSDIILFVCEDELTIDDGIFSANPYNWGSGSINAVATRHDLKLAKAKGNVFGTTDPNQNGYGNVSFCDGHAERMSRVDALRAKHTGNPYPDPVTPPF